MSQSRGSSISSRHTTPEASSDEEYAASHDGSDDDGVETFLVRATPPATVLTPSTTRQSPLEQSNGRVIASPRRSSSRIPAVRTETLSPPSQSRHLRSASAPPPPTALGTSFAPPQSSFNFSLQQSTPPPRASRTPAIFTPSEVGFDFSFQPMSTTPTRRADPVVSTPPGRVFRFSFGDASNPQSTAETSRPFSEPRRTTRRSHSGMSERSKTPSTPSARPTTRVRTRSPQGHQTPSPSESRSSRDGGRQGRDAVVEYLTAHVERIDLGVEEESPAPEEIEVENITLQNLVQAKEATEKFLRGVDGKLCDALRGANSSRLPSFVGWLRNESKRLIERCGEKHEVKVAFLGNTGCGKSTLINSLLGKAQVAPPSSGGEACTCTLTNYRKSRSNDRRPEIEVTFMTREQWDKEAEEIVAAMQEYEAMPPTERGGELGVVLGTKSSAGLKMFQSLFPEVDKGRILVEGNNYIKSLASDLESKTTIFGPRGTALFGKTISKAFDRDRDFVNGIKALSAKDFNAEAYAMWRRGDRHRPPKVLLWPIIIETTIYVDSPLLSNGLVLVDLPGQLDSNRARSAVAIKALSVCDEIFVVAGNTRARSESTVSEMMRTGIGHQIQQSGLYRVGIVVTQCDIFDDDMDYIHEHYSHVLPRAGEPELSLRTLVGRVLVARNEATKRSLERSMKDQLKVLRPNVGNEFQVDVFCVSGHDYDALTTGRASLLRSRDAKFLNARDTEIPALREHCRGMVEGRLVNKLENLLRGDCMSFINGITALLDEGSPLLGDFQPSDTTAAEVLQAIEKMEKDVDSNVMKVFNSIKSPLKDLMDKADTCTENSIDQCLNISRRWESMAYNSYQATCRGNGYHVITSRQEVINWNADLLGEYVDLVTTWDKAHKEMQSENFRRLCAEKLLRTFDCAIPSVDIPAENSLTTSFQIRNSINQVLKDIKLADRNTRKLFTHPGSGDYSRRSAIGQLMADTYFACLNVPGHNGYYRRAKDKMTEELENKRDEMFGTLNDEIKKRAYDAILPGIESELKKSMSGIFEKIRVIYVDRHVELHRQETEQLEKRSEIIGKLQEGGLFTGCSNTRIVMQEALQSTGRS